MKFWPLVLAGLLVGCGAPTANTNTNDSAVAAKSFSKADYEQVKTGMTLAQVEQALGAKGEEVSSSDMEMMGKTVTTAVYIWKNPDFSNATVTLQDGKVAAKAQTNLK